MVDVSLDFGMLDGKPVTLRELPLTQYGLRCKLACPECGKPLESVRRSVEHPEYGWKCLRHHVGEDSKCEGYGETAATLFPNIFCPVPWVKRYCCRPSALVTAFRTYLGIRITAPAVPAGQAGHGNVANLLMSIPGGKKTFKFLTCWPLLPLKPRL